ncbi:glycosyltransferase family 2 protein [Fusobacterium sp.]|uniref:glycosyltransferase family 2 protein n=1 Tax=Fusobacterium sp. TaxID=68766 RepID=UPI00260B0FBF|nr:glycosyltransferase family 2 protein [Fusobacterium sp.]
MKVSIIIPVYNKENYIKRCLESILDQTYSDLEIFCVDDGSTDKSYNILKEYQEKDKRIIVIKQENRGVGEARNTALKKVIGDYILFVDADDALKKDAIETYLKHKEYDLVISGFSIIDINKKIEHIPLTEIIKKEKISEYLSKKENSVYTSIVCAKCFSKKIIKENNLFFKNIQYGEDTYFMYQYLKNIKNIYIVNKSLYLNYCINNSLSRKNNYETDKIFNYMFEIYEEGLKVNPLDLNLNVFLFMRSVKTILLLLIRNNEGYGNFKNVSKKLNIYFPKKIDIFKISVYDSLILFLLKFKLYFLLYILIKLKNMIKL